MVGQGAMEPKRWWGCHANVSRQTQTMSARHPTPHAGAGLLNTAQQWPQSQPASPPGAATPWLPAALRRSCDDEGPGQEGALGCMTMPSNKATQPGGRPAATHRRLLQALLTGAARYASARHAPATHMSAYSASTASVPRSIWSTALPSAHLPLQERG